MLGGIDGNIFKKKSIPGQRLPGLMSVSHAHIDQTNHKCHS